MSAAMGLALAGGAIQANSQISAGNQANKIGQDQQEQFNANADLLDDSANAAEGAGINAASASKRKNKFVQSRITALNAANGGDSTDKNTAELLANTEAEGEYDALNNLYQGTSRATQLRNEGINQRNSGSVARYEGKSAKAASRINAITSLIGAGSSPSNFSNKYK